MPTGHITSKSGNYFITCAGRDVFGVIEEALEDATKNDNDVFIE
jgi:hypothetical protein